VVKGTRRDKNWLRRSFLNAMMDKNGLKVKDVMIEAAELYWLPLICFESESIKLSSERLEDICLNSINKLQERIEVIREIQETLIQDEEGKVEFREIEF
jgi:hypothetical protein